MYVCHCFKPLAVTRQVLTYVYTSLFKRKSQTSVPHIKVYIKNALYTLTLLHVFL